MKRLLHVCVLAASLFAPVPGTAAEAFNPSPHAIDIPQWFKASFLDFREDIAESTRQGKRLAVYFGQDGCPYCRELMRANFGQKDIAEKARRHFDIVALNIWGDREVVGLDRSTYSEKSFAALMKVQFTPTLLFFDETGKIVLRASGPSIRSRASLTSGVARTRRSRASSATSSAVRKASARRAERWRSGSHRDVTSVGMSGVTDSASKFRSAGVS